MSQNKLHANDHYGLTGESVDMDVLPTKNKLQAKQSIWRTSRANRCGVANERKQATIRKKWKYPRMGMDSQDLPLPWTDKVGIHGPYCVLDISAW